MSRAFDNLPFNDSRQIGSVDAFQTMLQQVSQNPKAFEEQLRMSNPQAYQRAMQIRNSSNPRAMLIELAKSRGVNPNILKMFGLQ